jgi:hypothetical protein
MGLGLMGSNWAGKRGPSTLIIKLAQATWLGLTLWVDDVPLVHTLEGTGRGWRKSMCAACAGNTCQVGGSHHVLEELEAEHRWPLNSRAEGDDASERTTGERALATAW